MNVRVRFAPSPTGDPHVGSIRTALFNWLWARKNHGKFILRIEDTDQERYKEGSLNAILEGLKWLGLNWDEGPFYQSKRLEIYREHAQRLLDGKKAYYCFCTRERLESLRIEQAEKKIPPHYDKHCLHLSAEEIGHNLSAKKPYVIRLNISAYGRTEFSDIIRGRVSFENKNLDDPVLVKSDGFPTYHLANVVDDHLMAISHVIRAEEWLPSTPKHVLLYQAFGFKVPIFAHLPLILSRDRKKLSKRFGSVSILDYKKEGYLPEAMMNFLVLLGWNPKTEQEMFTKDELVENFSLDKINKAGAIFNLEKLNSINGLYIRRLNLDDLVKRGNEYLQSGYLAKAQKEKIDLKKLWQMCQDRINTLLEINHLCDFVFEESDYFPDILVPVKGDKAVTKENLIRAEALVNEYQGEFKSGLLRQSFNAYLEKEKIKTNAMLWPLRVALSGKRASPDVFDMLELFGRDRSLEKIKTAINKL